MRWIPVVLGLLIAVAVPATAAPGDLDPSYSGDGIAFAFLHGAVATSATIDGQDRLVVAGYGLADHPDVAVARFLPNGSLDGTFGTAGRVRIDLGANDYGLDVAVVPGDGIAVAGRTTSRSADVGFVLRLDGAGARSSSFGGGDGLVRIDFGRSSQSANALAVTPKGRLVVGGFASNTASIVVGLARLLGGGRFDRSFGGDGRQTVDLSPGAEQIADLAVLAGGRVLAAGDAEGTTLPRFALARFDADGSLDRTFGTSAGVTLTDVSPGSDVANAMTIRPDGKIVLVGRAGNGGALDWGLARYTADGILDPVFGDHGKVAFPFTSAFDEATSVVSQGVKILVSGRIRGPTSDDLAVARVLRDGSLDPTFGGGDGRVLVDADGGPDVAAGIVLQASGKIVVAGTGARAGVLRFLAVRLLPA
jgi:uncharacterized delta-60 repeat protein